MARQARYDDLHTGTIAYATLVSCIVLIITILLVRALCCAWVESEEARKSVNAHYYSADTAIAEQKSRVSTYGIETVERTTQGPDGKPGKPMKEERIHIRVQDAKEILLKELATSHEPSA